MQISVFYFVYMHFLKKEKKNKNIQNIKKMITRIFNFSKHAFSEEYQNELKLNSSHKYC